MRSENTALTEIIVEHSREEKTRRRLSIKPERRLFVIGSSKTADLKIAGPSVVGCHAVLRYRAPHWYVCDVSGTESLRVNDRKVTEARIEGVTTVEIGAHRLKLFAKESERALFHEGSEAGTGALHQVVVFARGRVVETKLLKAAEPYVVCDGETATSLAAPTSSAWVTTRVGAREIRQRLVGVQETVTAERLEFDRGLRQPFMIGLVLMLSLVGAMLLVPKGQEAKPEAVLDKKSMDVIFNAKAVKMKRAESQKVVKSATARGGGSTTEKAGAPSSRSTPETSTAPLANPKAAAALTSIRSSGLNSLIGKIAKRAAKQGIFVGAAGVSPDKAGSGRALYSTGTTLGTGGGVAAKEGPTYRLGGVATSGKGGGVGGGNLRAGTALAGNGVGTGEIVASIDEETVIDGGLDRDAIAEVIKRNIGQIRYCYERQLSSNPDLYGKVMVKFTIGASGDVSEPGIASTTLKSAMVEGCIMRRLASWKFPLPKGGTQVRVTYPFLFKALD
jgi:outer membrane biosynthesis protein TonB